MTDDFISKKDKVLYTPEHSNTAQLESGRCESCAFWVNQISKHFGEDLDDRKTCKCPKIHYGYHTLDIWMSDMVNIENDEGWGMLTGPKFGCVHWNIKE